ncbi:TPA: hypothetical protein ACX6NV_000562 [Photobacterium damselae]
MSYVFDFIGLIGFCSFAGGLYLQLGLELALIVNGILLVVFSIAKSYGGDK